MSWAELFEPTYVLAEILGPADDLGYYGRRLTPNGRSIAIVPLTFARARLVLLDDYHCPCDGW